MKKIMMIIALVAAVVLPTIAQNNQEWQSTSTLQGSGSAYSAQVTEVGAMTASSIATTTETYNPAAAQAPGGPNRAAPKDGGEDYPIGDPVWPLAIMCVAFCAIVYARKRRALNR